MVLITVHLVGVPTSHNLPLPRLELGEDSQWTLGSLQLKDGHQPNSTSISTLQFTKHYCIYHLISSSFRSGGEEALVRWSQQLSIFKSQLCPSLPISTFSEISPNWTWWEYLPMEISKYLQITKQSLVFWGEGELFGAHLSAHHW